MSEAPAILARDLLLRVAEQADRYAIHAALDSRWGRRGDSRYRWALGAVGDGPAVRVRLPPDHPAAPDGVPVLAVPAGTRLAFRLRANITHKIERSSQRRSWPLEEMAPRRQWLERRAVTHGFAVETAEIEAQRVFIRKGRGFWIDETIFTGTLRVEEATAFAAALAGGVGQRGAFGFGLLETF